MSRKGPRPLTLHEKANLADKVGDYAALQRLNAELVGEGKASAEGAKARNGSFGWDPLIIRVVAVLVGLYLLGWGYALTRG